VSDVWFGVLEALGFMNSCDWRMLQDVVSLKVFFRPADGVCEG
jgi:hypothetical protein